MIKAIMKIHTTSSSVTFVCGDVAIIGNGEFRASSGKVDGFRIPQRKEDSQCMKMTAAYSLPEMPTD